MAQSGPCALSYSNGSSDLNDSTSSARYSERGVFAVPQYRSGAFMKQHYEGTGPAGPDAARASLHWHPPLRRHGDRDQSIRL
jgi:hypothetical protein